MKKLFAAVLIASSFISFKAGAQERAGDAALGAVSGALVLGPVGAVAGAIIGYTAGPSIAHSWGGGQSAPRPRVRRTTQTSAEPRAGQPSEAGTQGAGIQESKIQESKIQESKTQGSKTQESKIVESGTQTAAVQQQAAAKVSSAPALPTSEPAVTGKASPPVQGFE
jgi:hypothetical protein